MGYTCLHRERDGGGVVVVIGLVEALLWMFALFRPIIDSAFIYVVLLGTTFVLIFLTWGDRVQFPVIL